MTVQVRGAVSDGEAASATRYRVELEGAGGTMRIPCAPGVFPHHSTLVPFISAFRGAASARARSGWSTRRTAR
jgi:hypothetical protein